MNASSLPQKHALSLAWFLFDTGAAQRGVHVMEHIGGGCVS